LKTRHFFALTSVVLLAGLARTAAADIPLVDTEANKLSLYGWIKGDGTYQDDDMNSKVAPRFAVGDGDNADRPALGHLFTLGSHHADDQRLPLADRQYGFPARPGSLHL